MTIKQHLRKTNKNFVKYGRLAKFWGLMGKAFRNREYLDKSVAYLDKRWKMMNSMQFKHK